MKVRMMNSVPALVAALLTVPLVKGAESSLIAYPFPKGVEISESYRVTVKDRVLPVLQTKRGAILSFGMTGPLELKVETPAEPGEVVVRPLSAGIQPVMEEGGFRIRLPEPMNLSVELDGDLENPLLVFANGPVEKPDPEDPKVHYYRGGMIHDVGKIELKDGETLFLEGGAVVRAVVRAVEAKNVAVRGPGILDGSTRDHKINFLVLRECRDARLEDFILLDPLGWSIHLSASRGVTMRNTRVVGWRKNSDGLDIEYSSDIDVEGCFWRTNDDCIAVKAIYPPGVEGVPFEEMINPEFLGGHELERVPGDKMGNIDIRRCVLWNDQGGQGFEVGFELRIDEICGIRFTDSDIIHVLGGGAFTIHNGDRARIHDLHIEDIRVENTERFLDFHVGLSIYSEDCPRAYQRSNPERKAPPRRPQHANNPWQWYIPDTDKMRHHEACRGLVQGVTLRNIRLLKRPAKGSILNGFSKDFGISDVVLEDVVIEGDPVRSAEDAEILANEHVRGLRFGATK